MGLTIHYALSSKTRSAHQAKALVERMRQLALDLPFERVDDKVRHLGPEVCQLDIEKLRGNDAVFAAVLDGSKHVNIPWHRKQSASVMVQPLEVFSFDTVPGPGSEWASFGLARYPAEVEAHYSPRSDDRFIKTVKEGCSTRWQFDWSKWERWTKANGHKSYALPDDETFQEMRRSRPDSPRAGTTRRSVRPSTLANSVSPTSSVATFASSTCSTVSPSCPP